MNVFLPTLEWWVYINSIHGPLDGPLYTWAQYTPTLYTHVGMAKFHFLVVLTSPSHDQQIMERKATEIR